MTDTLAGSRVGDHASAAERWPLAEGLTSRDGRSFYTVPDVDELAPFLMSVVSDGDRWMFASSSGALTAGRRDSTRALFPYETEDRIHRSAGQVGPVTAIRREGAGSTWRPFVGPRRGRRSLHKSVVGDELVHVDRHDEWGLEFSYRWASSDRFGFIREAVLTNHGTGSLGLELVDGLLDVLPHGVDPTVYRAMGNLTNAYKRSEVTDGRLAVFSLESSVSDRPEPSEVLRANVVWSVGLAGAEVSVDAGTLTGFESGSHHVSRRTTGVPGAYLLSGRLTVAPGESATWYVVGDVALDQAATVALRHRLDGDADLATALRASIDEATRSLTEIMARPDGLQRTGDPIAAAHHFSNTTYNVMRGGIPLGGYEVDITDFTDFIGVRNRTVLERNRTWLAAQPTRLTRRALIDRVADTDDADLRRLTLEYLPFSFSRRHGDPSRPWNAFSIRVRDPLGRPIVYHEGNWRDIFQNWEALCVSYPDYLPSVIATFLNASTADGFNPYRITRDGIDWEVPEPENPWANIGYWGDHQVVYLLRLLELSEHLRPGDLRGMLAKRWFSYADVPYRLAPHDQLLADPKSTITFDEAAAGRSAERVAEIGGDGRLLHGPDGDVLLVSMFEKLLVPALTKLSSFVPGGGIWMNTQRPEWNDANNALAGFGLSMVTLSHLRAYLTFLGGLVEGPGTAPVGVSTQVADWLGAVADAFHRHDPDGDGSGLFHDLGFAFARYRERVYQHGLSGSTTMDGSAVLDLCAAALPHIDATIRANRRPDGLFHSYNIARFEGPSVRVDHLPEMLEGQVAVLDSGLLPPDEQARLVEALFDSALYAPDRRSFMLYPPRDIPSFLDKNVLPDGAGGPLVTALLDAGETSIVTRDADGRVRFDAGFAQQADLEAALDRLEGDPRWTALVHDHRSGVLGAYEDVFHHHAYTGRSGSMYAYEGIGSIYWHMVAKLLVAVQESLASARRDGADAAVVSRLVDAYRRVGAGLGYHKTAKEFGAIPIDPYSHTPAHAGAQQPGMTGLVKEELLARWLELGISFDRGGITFDPVLIRPEEALDAPAAFSYLDVGGSWNEIDLEVGSLAYTLCQVPVVVHLGASGDEVRVSRSDGSSRTVSGRRLEPGDASEVYARTGSITRIDAFLRLDP